MLRLLIVDATDNWDEQALVRVHECKQLDIYVFDPEVEVHCCELTPSYECHFAYSTFLPPPEILDDDELLESIGDEVREGEGNTPAVHYVHVSDVEASPLVSATPLGVIKNEDLLTALEEAKTVVSLYDPTMTFADEKTKEEVIEEALQSLQDNSPM